jgi:DNA-directed RNA polymerase subunit RPC12/RpoP
MFVTGDGPIECADCGQFVDPSAVNVHSIRRLEGASDPADMSAVLAVTCPACGSRATMVVRFGPEAGVGDDIVWKQTRDCRGSGLLPPDATPSEDTTSS